MTLAGKHLLPASDLLLQICSCHVSYTMFSYCHLCFVLWPLPLMFWTYFHNILRCRGSTVSWIVSSLCWKELHKIDISFQKNGYSNKMAKTAIDERVRDLKNKSLSFHFFIQNTHGRTFFCIIEDEDDDQVDSTYLHIDINKHTLTQAKKIAFVNDHLPIFSCMFNLRGIIRRI